MLVSEWFRDSLAMINAQAARQPVDGDKFETAKRHANDLMYENDGLGLGFTEVSNAGQTVTSPAYANAWLKKALAISLVPDFGQLESYALLKEELKSSYQKVLSKACRVALPTYPGTLPLGSGNMGRNTATCNNHYIPESENGILSESNQEIVVEDATP